MLDQLGGEEYGFGRLWEEQMRFLRVCIAIFARLLEEKYPKIVQKYVSLLFFIFKQKFI